MEKLLHSNIFSRENSARNAVKKTLDSAEENVFSGIEIGSKHLKPGKNEEEIQAVKSLLESYEGKIILGAHTINETSLCHPQKEKRQKRINFIQETAEIAKSIDSPFIVSSLDPVPEGKNKEEAWKLLLNSLKSLDSRLGKKKISLSIENDVKLYKNTSNLAFDNIVNSFEDVKELKGKFSNISLTFDPCNALIEGEKIPKFLENVSMFRHLHLKDGKGRGQKYSLKRLGEGKLEINRILEEAGKSIPTVTLEHPGGVRNPNSYVTKVSETYF